MPKRFTVNPPIPHKRFTVVDHYLSRWRSTYDPDDTKAQLHKEALLMTIGVENGELDGSNFEPIRNLSEKLTCPQ